MKQAFRYVGIGLFLAGALLFGLNHFNALDMTTSNKTNQSTTVTKATNNGATTTQNTQTTQSTTTTTTTRANETLSLTVTENDTSYVVAERLLQMGVITSVDEFNRYMEDHDLSSYIQTGTFTLKKGMSLEELGNTLTTYPGN